MKGKPVNEVFLLSFRMIKTASGTLRATRDNIIYVSTNTENETDREPVNKTREKKSSYDRPL